MRLRTVGVAALFFIGGVGAVLTFRLVTSSGDEERGRSERGETCLVVSNLAGVSCTLFRAGQTLDESTPVREFDGSSIWLQPGDYYLRAADRYSTSFFPVSLTGYRCGPDNDGTFLVAIRPFSSSTPPLLLPDLPPFVHVPAGTFLIGDRQNPREPHFVWLSGYFIAPFEVSNAEFRAFLEAPGGYSHPENWTAEGLAWKSSGTSHATALLTPGDREYGRCGQADQPVTWVTWFEAQAYCRWLTRTIGGGGRWQFVLPTEAEWEKAARGPDGFGFSLGNRISDNQAGFYNWKKNAWMPETVVGWMVSKERFRPNRYGLFHMTGNVVEWTRSLHEPYNREHPYTEAGHNNENASGSRVARGGSWYSASIAYLSIAYRDAFQPAHRSQEIGFRVVARLLP